MNNPSPRMSPFFQVTTECVHLKVSPVKNTDLIRIEHFSTSGDLLSEAQMTCEEAWEYARNVVEVADAVAGI